MNWDISSSDGAAAFRVDIRHERIDARTSDFTTFSRYAQARGSQPHFALPESIRGV
jgi:hypothetical protein